MSLRELWGFASCATASQSRGILEEAAFQEGLKEGNGPKWIRKWSCWLALTNPATQPLPLACCQASSRGHGHRTSKGSLSPCGASSIASFDPNKTRLGLWGDTVYTEQPPAWPTSRAVSIARAWILEWLWPLHPGQPCSHSHGTRYRSIWPGWSLCNSKNTGVNHGGYSVGNIEQRTFLIGKGTRQSLKV